MFICLLSTVKKLLKLISKSKKTSYIPNYTTEDSCNEIDYLDYSPTKKELWMR